MATGASIKGSEAASCISKPSAILYLSKEIAGFLEPVLQLVINKPTEKNNKMEYLIFIKIINFFGRGNY